MKVILLIIIGVNLVFAAEVFKDTDTGLFWQDNKDAKVIKKNWDRAKVYCEKLILLGKNDWRLPSIKELQTIVDVTKKWSPAIKGGFKNVSSYSDYWSSSEYMSNSYMAWKVDFKDGATYKLTKSKISYVRCVRGR
jgi:hypothetical protein